MKTIIIFSLVFLQLLFPIDIPNGIINSPHNLNNNLNKSDLSLCRSCHLSDGNSIDSTHRINSDDLCLNCHNDVLAKYFKNENIDKPNNINLNKFSHHFNIGKDDEIHCINCHNPHDNSNGNFLREIQENICLDCHEDKNFAMSVHKSPINPANRQNENIKCNSCHDIHLISSHKSLLTKPENQLCVDCHDGTSHNTDEYSSHFDINLVINKMYTHITTNNSDKKESIQSVVCSDCHNPHQSTEMKIGLLDGSLNGTDGLSPWGLTVEHSTYEYQICYKCHSYSNHQKTKNIAELFKRTNASYHPIENISNNINAAKSLKSGWGSASLMDCSDCHGNDNTFGIQGPHGSNHKGLLKNNFEVSPFTLASTQQDNALCFQCHDEVYILQSAGFRWHKLHIDNGYNCSACHDSHGSKDYPTLLKFNSPYIKPNPNGNFDFNKTTTVNGSCTMTCHGHVHIDVNY